MVHITNDTPTLNPHVAVMHITARRDYAVAKAFHEQGALALMATDLMLPHWGRLMARGLLKRYLIKLPKEKIIGAPVSGLAYRGFMRMSRPFTAWPHIWAAKRVAKVAVNRIAAAAPDIVYGLDTGALELFQQVATISPRPKLVLEQCVAPRASQLLMVDRLAAFMPPDLVRHRKANIELLKEREEKEWRLADLVLAPSVYVSEELVAAGCPAQKIRLVPYGYSPRKDAPYRSARRRTGPLRGLFVGGVDYRKGVHDLAAVAGRFAGRIQIDVLGKVMVEDKIATEWGKALSLKGQQPFNIVQQAYLEADFLVLPSYLEGSAMVVYEAMSYGLPCIVTRETGSVITHGHDGFIFEAGDQDGLATVLSNILDDIECLDFISRNAKQAAQQVSAEQYSERLLAAVMS